MSKFDRFKESSNPMFNEDVIKNTSTVLDEELVGGASSAGTMTVNGAVNKTLALFGIMLIGASVGFMFPSSILMWTGVIGGAIIYFITSRNPSRAPYLAPLYAVVEGLLVGTVTAMYIYAFDGIVFQAVTATMGILFLMLTLYKVGLVQVTQKFRSGVTMAVGAVMLMYLVTIVLGFLGINIPFLHDGGPISIGITAVIIVVASLNLLLDFDNFEKGAQMGAPKYMEWYFGMGLLFTLIWLYLEILRLLSYLRD